MVRQGAPERALLVLTNSEPELDAQVEGELYGLCEAAWVQAVGHVRQRLTKPVRATFIGKGKVQELRVHAQEARADVVIVDGELTGLQVRNLEEALQRRVIDRTQLILDIFARRASTREGQLQVELAQLTYLLPRLMSVYTKFERQRGGVGLRGPGETQLETDRRQVRNRIAKLTQEIEEVKQHRALQRSSRMRQPHPCVALVGYTSAGKSSLMNRLCGTDLPADSMPFSTLDPTTRRLELPQGTSVFLTDTVGFIRNLPTHLVAAFRSTLEEVVQADLILHVIDVANPWWDLQRDAVLETLESLGASRIPLITVFNKCDLVSAHDRGELSSAWPEAVQVSAVTGEGISELMQRIEHQVMGAWVTVRAMLPYDRSALVEECYRSGQVRAVRYLDEGIWIEARVDSELRARLRPYVVES
jgi:GTP-binding protein HflX